MIIATPATFLQPFHSLFSILKFLSGAYLILASLVYVTYFNLLKLACFADKYVLLLL